MGGPDPSSTRGGPASGGETSLAPPQGLPRDGTPGTKAGHGGAMAWHGPAWPGTARRSRAGHGMAHRGPARPGTAWHGTGSAGRAGSGRRRQPGRGAGGAGEAAAAAGSGGAAGGRCPAPANWCPAGRWASGARCRWGARAPPRSRRVAALGTERRQDQAWSPPAPAPGRPGWGAEVCDTPRTPGAAVLLLPSQLLLLFLRSFGVLGDLGHHQRLQVLPALLEAAGEGHLLPACGQPGRWPRGHPRDKASGPQGPPSPGVTPLPASQPGQRRGGTGPQALAPTQHLWARGGCSGWVGSRVPPAVPVPSPSPSRYLSACAPWGRRGRSCARL